MKNGIKRQSFHLSSDLINFSETTLKELKRKQFKRLRKVVSDVNDDKSKIQTVIHAENGGTPKAAIRLKKRNRINTLPLSEKKTYQRLQVCRKRG